MAALDPQRPARAVAAGRTDSGVHAAGQVVHFDAAGPIPAQRWAAALNGRLPASIYAQSVLYTTLSPCPMCTGAILLYGIPRVVVGENQTFMGDEEHLRSQGVKVDVLNNAECIQMMRDFIAAKPQLWNEDIGV